MIANTVMTATWVAEIIKALSKAKYNIVAKTTYDNTQLIGRPRKVSMQASLNDGQSSFIYLFKYFSINASNINPKI